MRDNSNEQELEVKGEREGKFKGALKAMKRYPSNLRIRLSKLHEKQPVGEAAKREACESMAKFAPGYKSLPATPCISKSTEDIRRERSFTNYLQVPPSPGVFPGLVKRLSELTPPVLEDEEPRQHFSFSKPSLKGQLSNVAEQEANQKEDSVCTASEEQCEGK
ncbi:uncharacterized protein LOC110058431 [Orbicella faveolata]|uniref:uncharacterized protein LOC110058431 n=1 Tax=Orbicella faveolata TaxID=48498 RepID=UPI0009E4412A|nr:uncharacterized protein LOC110058431 [Orbicella faveolata]